MSDESTDTAVALVEGISQEQWSYWHQHPCSRLLRRYLKDYAEATEMAAVELWKSGKIELSLEHEMRSRIVQLKEIEILKFEDLMKFYDVPKEQT